MHVVSIHARTLDTTPDRVGPLLDRIGSEHDPLWPADRWPDDMRIRFDRPLGPGATGGHGSIRYAVEDYEPGRRVVFRFTGSDGTHRMEVEADGADRTRISHTLESDLTGSERLLWPIIRRFHDAYIEDMFDRAEAASTQGPTPPTRQPRWLRLWNAWEMRRDRWRVRPSVARWAGVLVPATLLAIAAIHGAWALGWRWPGGSDQALADRVVGPGASLPSAELTWAVAALLAGAAASVRAASRGLNGFARLATSGTAAVLLLRGAFGIVTDLTGGLDDIYEKLDLAIYSPLCLALGAGAAVVSQDARSRQERERRRQGSSTTHPRR